MEKLTKDQEYDIARGVLKSVASLRALLRNFTLDQVDDFIDKFKTVRTEKFEEYEELSSLVEEKEKARMQAVAKLEAANIDIPKQLATPITVDMLISGQFKINKPK